MSHSAAEYGRQRGITVIEGGCPCMFGPTTDPGHKAMRLVYTLTGTVIAVVAFLALAGAWISGARFVGSQSSSASFGMAAATTITVLGYVTILFLPARRPE